MDYVSKSSSAYSATFFGVLIAVSIAAGAVIVLEAIKLQQFGSSMPSATVYTYGLMMASLATVVLSVIVPERLGKALLLMGSIGFFACLAVALVYGMRA